MQGNAHDQLMQRVRRLKPQILCQYGGAARRSLRVALSTLRKRSATGARRSHSCWRPVRSVQINSARAITIDLSTFSALIRSACPDTGARPT